MAISLSRYNKATYTDYDALLYLLIDLKKQLACRLDMPVCGWLLIVDKRNGKNALLVVIIAPALTAETDGRAQ